MSVTLVCYKVRWLSHLSYVADNGQVIKPHATDRRQNADGYLFMPQTFSVFRSIS